MEHPLLVAVDVGSRFHEVAVGDAGGSVLDTFRIDHDPDGFSAFFNREYEEKIRKTDAEA